MAVDLSHQHQQAGWAFQADAQPSLLTPTNTPQNPLNPSPPFWNPQPLLLSTTAEWQEKWKPVDKCHDGVGIEFSRLSIHFVLYWSLSPIICSTPLQLPPLIAPFIFLYLDHTLAAWIFHLSSWVTLFNSSTKVWERLTRPDSFSVSDMCGGRARQRYIEGVAEIFNRTRVQWSVVTDVLESLFSTHREKCKAAWIIPTLVPLEFNLNNLHPNSTWIIPTLIPLEFHLNNLHPNSSRFCVTDMCGGTPRHGSGSNEV